MRTAIIPGSFDPMTIGHKNIIERSSRLFDRIIVAIMVNPDKKGFFSFAERKKIAELSLADIENVTVMTADGYLADLAAALGACAIIKGVRNADDFEYEQEMAAFNHDRNPHCETMDLPAYGDMSDVSSSLVRRAACEEDVLRLIDRNAAQYIRELGRLPVQTHKEGPQK